MSRSPRPDRGQRSLTEITGERPPDDQRRLADVVGRGRDVDEDDQDLACPHGVEWCPGPDGPGDSLPCSRCFIEGDPSEGGESA